MDKKKATQNTNNLFFFVIFIKVTKRVFNPLLVSIKNAHNLRRYMNNVLLIPYINNKNREALMLTTNNKNEAFMLANNYLPTIKNYRNLLC